MRKAQTAFTCPDCDSDQLRVVDSRVRPEGRRRRFVCDACGSRVTSMERIINSKTDLIYNEDERLKKCALALMPDHELLTELLRRSRTRCPEQGQWLTATATDIE